MNAAAMRFSGGKDSTLAALQMAEGRDRLDLLTFRTSMIMATDRSEVVAGRLARILTPRTTVHHAIVDIEPTVRWFYESPGWFRDWKRYGSLARGCMCNACDLAMIVEVIIHCVREGIAVAFDGGNRTEFAGFLDDWGKPKVQELAARHGVRWEYPVYEEERTDLRALEAGLQADDPQLLYRNQGFCGGGGICTNMYMRCYYLPRHGPEGYQRTTLRWLEDRLELAHRLIERRLTVPT